MRAAILSVLSDAPRNGYQVIQEIAERTGGAWKPSPGSIYPTLQQLEDEGLVVQTDDGGRKAYALTDEGRGYVEGHPDEMAAPWAAMTETEGDLRPVLGQVAAAMWQVMAVGSPEQQTAARDAIVELRKTLYGILAEGTEHDPAPTRTGDEQGLAVGLAAGLAVRPAPGEAGRSATITAAAAVVGSGAATGGRRRSDDPDHADPDR